LFFIDNVASIEIMIIVAVVVIIVVFMLKAKGNNSLLNEWITNEKIRKRESNEKQLTKKESKEAEENAAGDVQASELLKSQQGNRFKEFVELLINLVTSYLNGNAQELSRIMSYHNILVKELERRSKVANDEENMHLNLEISSKKELEEERQFIHTLKGDRSKLRRERRIVKNERRKFPKGEVEGKLITINEKIKLVNLLLGISEALENEFKKIYDSWKEINKEERKIPKEYATNLGEVRSKITNLLDYKRALIRLNYIIKREDEVMEKVKQVLSYSFLVDKKVVEEINPKKEALIKQGEEYGLVYQQTMIKELEAQKKLEQAQKAA